MLETSVLNENKCRQRALINKTFQKVVVNEVCKTLINTDPFFCNLQNSRLEIPQPTSQEDRCMAADALISSGVLKTHLLVDSIDNNASKAFAAMPIRLYIIQNEIVQYAGGVGPTFYKPSEVAKWLENYILTDPNNNTLCKVEVV